MSALRELQTNFADAVFTEDCTLLAHCAGNPGRVAQGIAAYRRSILSNLATAVQATYPVLESIVGRAFLAAACQRYAQSYPSSSGDLNDYGGHFDEFLAADANAASLPYLPDIARLEWLIQQVYGATDAAPQDLSVLASTPQERWGELRFALDPAHALQHSRWPIVRIWQINQPNYDDEFTVDLDRAEIALIHRQALGIAVEAISAGEQALLLSLAAGKTLSEAVESAIAAEMDFDLQTALQRFIGSGLLRRALCPNGEANA